jgi:CysZ protein
VGEVLSAFVKAGRDLLRPELLWQAVWPPLAAFVFWGYVAFAVWAHGIAVITGLLPAFEWTAWSWIAHWAAVFLLLAAFASLVYFTALLLIAVFALPRMIALVAARDYPDLVRHGENVFWGSLGNTLVAGAVFILGWTLTLPLLPVPGAILVLPLCWTAWLNQRTFRVDALAEHATRSELRALVSAERPKFYMAGFGTALAAHVPVLNVLAPALAALAFVHLGLGALRRRRLERGIDL